MIFFSVGNPGWTITIKQNVISGEDASWKIRLDKIQNGRLSAIIHFFMADIW